MILSVHDSVFPVVRPNNRIIQLFPALQGVIKSGVYASLPLLLNTSIYGGVSGAERECNRFQRFPSHPLSIIPLFIMVNFNIAFAERAISLSRST